MSPELWGKNYSDLCNFIKSNLSGVGKAKRAINMSITFHLLNDVGRSAATTVHSTLESSFSIKLKKVKNKNKIIVTCQVRRRQEKGVEKALYLTSVRETSSRSGTGGFCAISMSRPS